MAGASGDVHILEKNRDKVAKATRRSALLVRATRLGEVEGTLLHSMPLDHKACRLQETETLTLGNLGCLWKNGLGGTLFIGPRSGDFTKPPGPHKPGAPLCPPVHPRGQRTKE
jgi:hypothetical protein